MVRFLFAACLLGMSCGCAILEEPLGRSDAVPYLAVRELVPERQNRIYLTAQIPGRVVISDDCVLFERTDGKIVLPVFEAGTQVGADHEGAYVYDPVSRVYLRDGTRVVAGGGGSDETVGAYVRRAGLQRSVPLRCVTALDVDSALALNPGIEPVR